MMVITFDTLQYAKNLEAAGIPSEQAGAQAEALYGILEANLGRLARTDEVATKSDVWEVRKEIEFLRKDMVTPVVLNKELEALRREMAQIKLDTIKWVVGLALAQSALIIGLFSRLMVN
ncbi:MAG: CCDC90 family protein [Zoogloeaceae bacterium]|nr:CCDC90 family protein [Zoogloeaceae bacterium]